MIVKNESHVITRCLDSVKDLIDTWVIVDTGSSDGTQDKIREHLEEIPGELYERPWVDFGHNRNEAMELAQGKSDYLLLIDADDRLVFSKDFMLGKLDADYYTITQRESYQSTFREHKVPFLIKNGDFKWEGVLHEYLVLKNPRLLKNGEIKGVFNEYINDGSRSKNPNKIESDICVLKEAIQKYPDNSRYVFYLARTYWSIRDYASAIPYFEQRAKMGGDPMEVYYSLLYIGLGQKNLNLAPNIFLNSLCKAYLYRPSRAESLYEVGRYYTEFNHFFLGYLVLKSVLHLPLSNDNLFVESWVYDWGVQLYFFICANQIGQKTEAIASIKKLLKNPRLPKPIREEFKLEEWGKALNIKY